jgi:hypothetical protein
MVSEPNLCFAFPSTLSKLENPLWNGPPYCSPVSGVAGCDLERLSMDFQPLAGKGWPMNGAPFFLLAQIHFLN